MISRKLSTAIFLFCFATAHLFGQGTGSIRGVVRDAATGEHLPFVNVLRSDDGGTATDGEGVFEIKGIAPGRYTLTASCIGYLQSETKDVDVVAGKTTTIAFELEPVAILGDEAIVTATRMPQAAKLAPASVAVITSQQIKEKNITTFDQAFDEAPGVVVTRASNANVQAFSIRGASEVAGGGIGNRVLLLVDGRPALSPESAGALWNLVPLNSIERIEVVKGAYSSLYGSSAMGGVVNVITRKPASTPQTKVHLNYGFYEMQSSNFGKVGYRDFHTIEANHSRSYKRFSYLLDGGWKHNDGHRQKSAFDLYNFYGKGTWALNGNRHLQITLNANRIHNDTPATWLSFNQPYAVAEHRKDDYQTRREVNADFYYYAIPSAKVKYSTRIFYYQNNSRYSFDNDPENDSTNVNKGKQVVAKSSIMAQRLGSVSQVDLFFNDKHAFVTGIDLNLDHIVGLPDTVLYGEHEAVNIGVYAQDEWAVAKHLTATMGARVDNYRILGEFHETSFSPKLALLYQPSKDLGVRALLAQAFRNPAMAERFIKFEQGGGLSFEPNPSLKSEKLTLSAELGVKWSLKNRSSFDVAVFYNKYKDLISFLQVSQPLEPLRYRVINLKEAVMQGFEIAYVRQIEGKARFNIGYTYLDAKDVSDGRLNEDLAYKMKHTLSVGATVFVGKLTGNVNARYRSAIKEVFIYPGSEPGAAFLLNAKIGWQKSNNLQFYLALDNLTNSQYEELERYRMPGRNYTAGATWEF